MKVMTVYLGTMAAFVTLVWHGNYGASVIPALVILCAKWKFDE